MIPFEFGTYEWQAGTGRVHGDATLAGISGVALDATGTIAWEECLAAIHPEDVRGARRDVERAVAEAKEFRVDVRLVTGGRLRRVTICGRAVRAATGGIGRIAGVVLAVAEPAPTEADARSATDQLQRQFRLYDAVLSATDDFAYIFDLKGRFLYANRRLLHVWSRTLDQIVGKTCYDLGYPTWHADMHMREIAQVIATRRSIQGEVPFTGESGISGIYDYIFTPVVGPGGDVESIAGTTRDVTARKHREDRDRWLIAADDAVRPLTDSLAITQTCARIVGEALQVNRCAYADVEDDQDTFNVTGDYTRDAVSIVGRYRISDFGFEIQRQLRAGTCVAVGDVAVDPRTASAQAVLTAMGIRAAVTVPLLKAGRLVALMALHQTSPRVWLDHEIDLLVRITSRCWESIERARVQRVLAESERRLQLAIATGQLGVWDLDLGTYTLTATGLCRAHHGRTGDESLTYDELWAAVHDDDRERVRAEKRRAIVEHRHFDADYRVVWPDGTVHWLAVRGEASYGPDGTPARMVGVSLDITRAREDAEELKAARGRLEDYARGLEASVAERTARLQETLSELEGFSYSISHDLRAPLRAIQSFASMVEAECSDQLGAEGRDYLRRIIRSSERMDRLIQDVLVYSRIARKEMPVERIELEPFIAGVLETYPHFNAADTDFEIVSPLGAVRANPAALTQCMSNLIGNAIKFVRPGCKPVIRIWTEPRDGRLAVFVRDNGIGIEPALHEKIFGIFYQIDTRYDGTGIGLSVVRKAAERMGGQIGLESSLGRGSTFRLELPAA
ncbi:PAS domain-containing sensor histidine kinase [Horticoccus sp. 23ND18S-11]|uniref:PAS domain-containing sensor histidine kinase n=1 Tax=Horticoccus sp. 23ND18S-11 TaxID=3391832 RepID=UPI0039C9511C